MTEFKKEKKRKSNSVCFRLSDELDDQLYKIGDELNIERNELIKRILSEHVKS